MSKHHNQDSRLSGKQPEFILFWSFIALEIGAHRLSINPTAKQPQELFAANSVHPDFLKQLILDSLKNKSDSLKQPIDINHVLDLLGETAFKLRANGSDDLYDIEMLEEIAWLIGERFSHLLTPRPHHDTSNSSHIVLSMRKFKERKQR